MKACYIDILDIALDILEPLMETDNLSEQEKSYLNIALKYLIVCKNEGLNLNRR